MFPPTPPPNQALIALLAAALGQQHPLMTGVQAGPPLDWQSHPLITAGGDATPAPMPSQGQRLAPAEGPLGENAHLGWGSAPPMDYHAALASIGQTHHSVNPHAMPQPGSPTPARSRPASRPAPPVRRGAGDFPRLRNHPTNYRVSGRY